jgi:hypothetical protein
METQRDEKEHHICQCLSLKHSAITCNKSSCAQLKLALNMNPRVSQAVRTSKQSNCRGNGLYGVSVELISQNVACAIPWRTLSASSRMPASHRRPRISTQGLTAPLPPHHPRSSTTSSSSSPGTSPRPSSKRCARTPSSCTLCTLVPPNSSAEDADIFRDTDIFRMLGGCARRDRPVET